MQISYLYFSCRDAVYRTMKYSSEYLLRMMQISSAPLEIFIRPRLHLQLAGRMVGSRIINLSYTRMKGGINRQMV